MQALRKIKARSAGFIFLLLIATLCLPAQQPSKEHQVKAVFLFNFTQFVEWPPGTFAHPETPFVIGVLGENPFGSYLSETINNEKANGHNLVVQYYSSVAEVKNCQVLFINLTDAKKQTEALEGLKGKNILTVSDGNNFLKSGGMIRFYTKDDKIRFQINPDATKAADLIVSSRLLRLAEIYTP